MEEPSLLDLLQGLEDVQTKKTEVMEDSATCLVGGGGIADPMVELGHASAWLIFPRLYHTPRTTLRTGAPL